MELTKGMKGMFKCLVGVAYLPVPGLWKVDKKVGQMKKNV